MKKLLLLMMVIGVCTTYMISNSNISFAKKAAKIGFVKVARGDVKIVRKGKEEKVKKRMKLLEGDQVTTGKKSLLTMFMKDGSMYTIPAESQLILQKYDVNDKKTKRQGSFKLMFGKLRGVVSSVKSKKPNVTIQTPSAVAGIRGTDFFLETAVDKKDKSGEADKKQLTKVACLSGNCLTGSLAKGKKKSSVIMETIASFFEGTAFAATTAKVDLVQVPAGTTVAVKKGMNLKEILGTAKKIPASVQAKIKSKTPASEAEHAEAATSQAMEIDAGSSENQMSDIDSGSDETIGVLENLPPAELEAKPETIIRRTKVTIIIDLSGVN